MNTLLLSRDEITDSRDDSPSVHARVEGERARHLTDELAVVPGSKIRVGVLNDSLGRAEVLASGPGRVDLALVLDEPPPPKLPLTLVVGLPRPKVARRLLIDAAAAGVERIVLLGTWRVPKSYWQSPLLTEAKIHEHLLRGLALGGDCVPPRVDTKRTFKPFAEDELPSLARDATALVAEPEADRRCGPAPSGPVVLCVGPERGFTEFERGALQAAGCRAVALGLRTLRVHAAVHVAVGRLF